MRYSLYSKLIVSLQTDNYSDCKTDLKSESQHTPLSSRYYYDSRLNSGTNLLRLNVVIEGFSELCRF